MAKVLGQQNAGAAPAGKAKDASEEYKKLTQLEHILLRPDTYIGSTESTSTDMLVFDADRGFATRNISYVPGLFKIFDEIIVNAADNKVRDPSMDALQVTINSDTNEISIYNTGRGIPVEKHREYNVYIPEMLFGHLLTGSNFNDKEDKTTGGRNGYGAKLCNIFSTKFVIETCDTQRGLKYKQVFRNNMGVKEEPIVSKTTKSDKDYTRVTFRPDLSRFGLDVLDQDHVALLTRRVWDVAATTNNVKVSLNGERIPVRKFKDYVDRVLNDQGVTSKVVHEKVNDRWEIAFTTSDTGFQQISFVNSIATTKGGSHIKHVEEQLTEHLLKVIKKKNKHAPVKAHQVRQHMYLFVNCLINNPSFDSQTKENMTRKTKDFGSSCSPSDKFLKGVADSGVVDNILHFAKLKSEAAMSRSHGGTKKSKLTGIPKLDDANEAGTRNAHKCTLILTEGDSAKALAISGLGVVGRDHYGVFPLRGKLLNVRDASHKQIMDNAEIKYICQIMGLKFGTKYDSVKQLRYGRLMIMADQDQDGSHIKGLLINFLHHYWPSLLQIDGFLVEFVTPIVKCVKGKQEKSFFTLPQYEAWCEQQNSLKGWKIKYYKGLGTSTPQEAKQYFSNMDMHQLPFRYEDNEDFDAIKMAFTKKMVEERKEWLRNLKAGTYLDHSQEAIRYSDFINKELILFSMADNVRSIPSVMDGFKPGQRKVLFSCFKRNLTSEIKVAQLAGYVAEHSSYHHGEQSLAGTIVNMAQVHVGSNNLNLLQPIGQFGTRLQGGKDAASARYIFTMLSPLARKLYHISDDDLLDYLEDDGLTIEPEFYAPILPMVLVNGSDGIGTGWSSSVPNYNPREVAHTLLRMIDGEEPTDLVPWYKGFEGEIIQQKTDKFLVRGCIEKLSPTQLEITELPVRTWTQSYKEFLETLQDDGKGNGSISDFTQHHTDTTVRFVVTMTEAQMAAAEAKGLHKFFKLESSLSTSNMTLFDSQGRIIKYESTSEIMREFFGVRLRLYQQRKALLADRLQEKYERLDNKVRFIMEVITGSLVLSNRKQKDILADLVARNYKPFPKKGKAKPTVVGQDGDEAAADDGMEEPGVRDYDYLLGMPLYSLTMEKVSKLEGERSEAETELQDLLAKTPQDLWKIDLHDFLAALSDADAAEAAAELEDSKIVKKSTGRKKKAPKRRSLDEAEDDEDWAPTKTTKRPAAAPKARAKLASTSSVADDVTAKPATKAPAKKTKPVERAPDSAPSSPPSKLAHSSTSTVDAESSPEMDLMARLKAKRLQKAKPAATKAPIATFVADDDANENDFLVEDKPVAKTTAKAKAKRAPRKTVVLSDDEDDAFLSAEDDEYVPEVIAKPVKKTAATKAKATKKTAAAKPKATKKTAAANTTTTKKPAAKSKAAAKPKAKAQDPYALSGSEDEELVDKAPVLEATPVKRPARARRATTKVNYVESEDEQAVELLDESDAFSASDDDNDSDFEM